MFGLKRPLPYQKGAQNVVTNLPHRRCCLLSFMLCIFSFVLICAWMDEHGLMKPPTQLLCMCVVFLQTWFLLHPADTWIFHQSVLTLWMSALSPALFLALSLLLIHLLPPSSYSPITSTTHPSHPHTRLIKARTLSRLALEKTPWRHLFILTIFRYIFSSPSFFPS